MTKPDRLVTIYRELSNGSAISLTSLAQICNVSLRTIYSYVSSLEHACQDCGVILSRPKAGTICLQGQPAALNRLEELLERRRELAGTTKQRRQDLIDLLLLRNHTISLRTMEEHFNVAKSSLVNDLRAIEQDFNLWKLELIRGSKGTRIEGKEQSIRDAKRIRLKDKLSCYTGTHACEQLLEEFYEPGDLSGAQEMLLYLERHLGGIERKLDRDELLITCTVFIERIRSHHPMTVSKLRPVTTGYHETEVFSITLSLCNKISQDYSLSIGELDTRWLNARISSVYREQSARIHTEQALKLEPIVNALAGSIGLQRNSSDIYDTLCNTLRQHLVPLSIRITNNNQASNPCVEEILECYPDSLESVQSTLHRFESDLGGKATLDEASYLVIALEAAREQARLRRRAILVLDMRSPLRALTEARVKTHFICEDIKTIDKGALMNADLDPETVIISTSPISLPDCQHIVISPFVTERDVRQLSQL